jgi:hypothetical protein
MTFAANPRRFGRSRLLLVQRKNQTNNSKGLFTNQ